MNHDEAARALRGRPSAVPVRRQRGVGVEEHPFRVERREVHAAVAHLYTEVPVPEGAVQRVRVVEVEHVGNVLDAVRQVAGRRAVAVHGRGHVLLANSPLARRCRVVLVLDRALLAARHQRGKNWLLTLEDHQRLLSEVHVYPALVGAQIFGWRARTGDADVNVLHPGPVARLAEASAAHFFLASRELDSREDLDGLGRLGLLGVQIDLVARRGLASAVHPTDGQLRRRTVDLDALELRPRRLPEAICGGDQALGRLVPSTAVPAEGLVHRDVEAGDHALGQDLVRVFLELVEGDLVQFVFGVVALPPR